MFRRFSNWLWLITNKKPPKPQDTYAGITLAWAMVGANVVILLILLALATTLLTVTTYELRTWVILSPVVAYALIVLLLVLATIRQQKRDGYYNAITKQGQACWEEKTAKLKSGDKDR